MALQPRFVQNTPAYPAIKMFGIAVAVGLVILGLLYVVYAGSRRDRRTKFVNRLSRVHRNRDLEAGTDTASRNSRIAPSVDTLPRYEAGDEAPSEQIHGEHELMEGEEVKPPPYTFDDGGPVLTGPENGDAQSEVRAGVTTPPAPVHFRSSRQLV